MTAPVTPNPSPSSAVADAIEERDDAWAVVADAAARLSAHGFPSCEDNGSSGGQPITLDEQITDVIAELVSLRKLKILTAAVADDVEAARQKIADDFALQVCTSHYFQPLYPTPIPPCRHGPSHNYIAKLVKKFLSEHGVSSPVGGASSCRHEWYLGKCVHCELTAKEFRSPPPSVEHVKQMERDAFLERVAQLTAHRACFAEEHNPLNGKIHGYCVVCGYPWPCETAKAPSVSDRGNSPATSVSSPEQRRRIAVNSAEELHEVQKHAGPLTLDQITTRFLVAVALVANLSPVSSVERDADKPHE